MVKRIRLLALMSSRAAAVRCQIVGIRSGSRVVGRSGETGHPAGPRVTCLSLYLSLSLPPWTHRFGSQGVHLLLWIGGGTGNTSSLGVNSPVSGDYLTSCDQKPEGPS